MELEKLIIQPKLESIILIKCKNEWIFLKRLIKSYRFWRNESEITFLLSCAVWSSFSFSKSSARRCAIVLSSMVVNFSGWVDEERENWRIWASWTFGDLVENCETSCIFFARLLVVTVIIGLFAALFGFFASSTFCCVFANLYTRTTPVYQTRQCEQTS